jgi:UDP-N-acetylmuramate-alanine ligase
MGGRPVVWAPTLERAREAVEARLRPGSVLVTVGAGDVFTLAEQRVEGGGEG